MRLLLAAVLAAACVPAARAENRKHGGPPHAPRHRPPSLPAYKGRVLPVPRARRASRASPAAPQARPTQLVNPMPRTPSVRPHAEAPRPNQPGLLPRSGTVHFRPPDRDQKGRPLQARAVANPARAVEMTQKTVALPAFAREADALSRNERERDGQYHWHRRDGVRYSHWYDRDRDRHWYGFYRGRQMLWTTYWNGRFWWQEPRTGRWLGYYRDHWWWRSPQNATYMYVDDSFYQWVPGANGFALLPPPPEPSPEPAPEQAAAPAPESKDESLVVSTRPEFHYSADGSRVVEIEGEKLSAYLFDSDPATRDSATPLRFLGDGVTAVEFSDVSDGKPLRITVSQQVEGGGIKTLVYDRDGAPVSETPPPPAPEPTAVETGSAPAEEEVLPPGPPPFADGEKAAP